MKKLAVLSICIALVFGLSFSSSAVASDEENALQVVENWAKAFNSGDFDAWSSLWWESQKTTQFGPPTSMAFLTQGCDAILNQVKAVFEYPKGTYACSVHNPQVTMLGNDVAVLTMYQILTINPPALTAQVVEQQRITFVVQKIGGKWLIVHAHGSMFPTE